MVFELTDTLIDNVVVENTDIQRSLNNLFIGYEEGNLLLTASPELLDFLEVNITDDSIRKIIFYLKNRPLVHYDVLWETKVVLDNPDINNHEIGIEFFRHTSAIQPPVFLCENLDDTSFYFYLCKEFFNEASINTKNAQGGGGSSVADALEHIVKSGDRFCLCIVDSDMKYEGASYGGTYVAIDNKKLNPSLTYSIYRLSVHEIENLIPIEKIIEHIKDRKTKKFANKLKTADHNGDILKYYDIKEGISIKAIENDQGYYNFAEIIYNRIKKPYDNTTLKEYIKSKKDTILFAPLCPGVLTTFLNRDKYHMPRFIYCYYLIGEWLSLRNYIVTFLCCRENTPLN